MRAWGNPFKKEGMSPLDKASATLEWLGTYMVDRRAPWRDSMVNIFIRTLLVSRLRDWPLFKAVTTPELSDLTR